VRDPEGPLEPDLLEAARGYHAPPATPREEMWRAIAARRAAPDEAGEPAGRAGGRLRGRLRGRPRPPFGVLPSRFRALAWGAGIAALLALGAGIGRLSVGIGRSSPESRPVAGGGTQAGTPRAPAAAEAAPARAGTAYRLVAVEHLGQAEAFLTLFRASVRQGRDDRFAAATARELLATNRLLLDSPAASDRRLKLLLEDLELVLAQIAQLSPERRREDTDLINDGLERSGVLVRLRAAVPAGSPGSRLPGAL